METVEIEFVQPTEENQYRLFADELENDPLVLFHGTTEDAAKSIIDEGFNPTEDLKSNSFGRDSGVPLGYSCSKRNPGTRGAVLAVQFDSLQVPCIREEGYVVYLDKPEIAHNVVAVCYVPKEYKHI